MGMQVRSSEHVGMSEGYSIGFIVIGNVPVLYNMWRPIGRKLSIQVLVLVTIVWSDKPWTTIGQKIQSLSKLCHDPV